MCEMFITVICIHVVEISHGNFSHVDDYDLVRAHLTDSSEQISFSSIGTSALIFILKFF